MTNLQPDVRVPKEILALLTAVGVKIPANIKEIETPVEFSQEVQKIILPKGMDKMVASKELENQWKNEEQNIDFTTPFENWNWRDVLVAVKRVTEHEFGWMNGKEHWWTGNPTEIDVVVDLKKGKKVNEKAFMGNFEITAWEKAKSIIHVDKFGVAHLQITAKRKYSEVITNYMNAIREQLETNSIYRGKNIVVSATSDPKSSNLDFEIIENKGSEKIVLNHAEKLVVDTFVIGGLGEPGKRCYLFTGSYGTGKTETAMRVGREAVRKHNMSFFYLKDANAFDTLLNQSKKYQPCIIFLEDVDEIASGDERNAHMNKILNTLDGVQTKGNDLTVIFTTNHPERINSALRRPGRIDLMVKFQFPDIDSRQEIYKIYFQSIPGADTLDYIKLARATPDVQGAVVAEIAKRALKLAKSKDGVLSNELVESCVYSMQYQIDLMSDKVEQKDEHTQFFELFGKLIAKNGFWKQEDIEVVIDHCAE